MNIATGDRVRVTSYPCALLEGVVICVYTYYPPPKYPPPHTRIQVLYDNGKLDDLAFTEVRKA